MIKRTSRLSNLGPMGLIVVLVAIIIGVQGMVLIIASSQNLDLKSFFVAFNQSVVENRQEANLTSEFRNIQLDNIEEQQNRTQHLLPIFLESLDDTRYLADRLPVLINNTANVSQLVGFLSDNFGAGSGYLPRETFQYSQANLTARTLNETLALLRDINSTLNGVG